MEREIEFLRESNAIEREYSQKALEDAIDGWNYAKEHRHEINMSFIEQVHERLMRRLNPGIAGKTRTKKVYIVKKSILPIYNEEKKEMIYIEQILDKTECLAPELVYDRLEKWVETYAQSKKAYQIKDAHVVFEKIHPFEDGNGRTGRILMNVQRLNAKLPLLVIHEGNEQFEYYKWFKEK